MQKLARFCLKYSPQIMYHKHECLLLDATGCGHLFGGNFNLLQHIQYDLQEMGFMTQIAMASNIRAANAFVQNATIGRPLLYDDKQRQHDALLQLPIDFLGLDDAIITQLQRVGLRKIEALIPIKTAALFKRFGETLPKHLGQALGHSPQAFKAIKFLNIHKVTKAFSEPVTLTCYLAQTLKGLLHELIIMLKKDGKAARRLCLSIYRPDHSTQSIDIGTSHPSLSQPMLFKLFELHLDKLVADFGIEKIDLIAAQTENYNEKDYDYLDENVKYNTPFSNLIDHIANKIGFEKIINYLPSQSHIPERSFNIYHHDAYILQIEHDAWAKPTQKRPARMLKHPFILFDFSFFGFEYNGEKQTIIRKSGPERILPEWWWDDPLWRDGARDYWWLTCQTGRQFWVYSTANKKYFLHGWS